ncbi:MAG: hypothetical protein QF858_02780 [Candidatus Pacebacteria bacterium]|jgi:hypothetical protein|nr:hypothetical protein [bacterium]MDP6527779.1 hypothetical protein [Candidatus Paceibacterota bacterium]MDP6659616.1 hypothetical protein [Candidatus Paceibacterota bacterium]|tara:strand:- start:43445 stop:43957 length:513 start_codon:yes stop_codon:yes gene_type:complete
MEFIHTQTFRVTTAFIIGLVVGGSGVWALFAKKVEAPEEQTAAVVEVINEPIVGLVDTTPSTELSKNPAIHVSNQSSGDSVIIEKVVLEEDGWVVIHEGTESSIGNALGATRLDAGEHQTTVELLRATEAGNIYRAVLYRDSGDRAFGLDKDFPVIDSSGGPVMTMFVIN